MNTKFILRQICINLNEAKRQWKAGWGEPEFGESEAYALTFLIQTHVRAHTLSPSLHTHSSESPASLPSLVSLGKKSLKKKNQSGALMAQILRVSPSFFCRLSLPYSIPASCRCLCAAPRLHILTQGLSNGSPFIFLSPHHLLLGLLTSLHCFSSQLSFPAVCLSTASPTASSSSSFLPPLSHFCLPLVPLF